MMDLLWKNLAVPETMFEMMVVEPKVFHHVCTSLGAHRFYFRAAQQEVFYDLH
jgi:hypothetical protein